MCVYVLHNNTQRDDGDIGDMMMGNVVVVVVKESRELVGVSLCGGVVVCVLLIIHVISIYLPTYHSRSEREYIHIQIYITHIHIPIRVGCVQKKRKNMIHS